MPNICFIQDVLSFLRNKLSSFSNTEDAKQFLQSRNFKSDEVMIENILESIGELKQNSGVTRAQRFSFS